MKAHTLRLALAAVSVSLTTIVLAAGAQATGDRAGSAPAAGRDGFFTTSDGVRLHYLAAGHGEPIVLVPGWTLPAEIWEPQLRGLSSRYRVIALDPRSQGRSALATEGHYPERRARDVRELLEHLGLQRVALVGWSLAVVEVLAYYDLFGADRLRALVLVDGFVSQPSGDMGVATWVAMAEALQRDRRGWTEKFVPGMYARPQPPAYLRRMTEASLRTPTSTAVTLALAYMGPSSDHRATLDRITCPVLFIGQGPFTAHGDTVRARLPSARVESLSGVGHALFVDDPARFNALLEEFLRATTP